MNAEIQFEHGELDEQFNDVEKDTNEDLNNIAPLSVNEMCKRPSNETDTKAVSECTEENAS